MKTCWTRGSGVCFNTYTCWGCGNFVLLRGCFACLFVLRCLAARRRGGITHSTKHCVAPHHRVAVTHAWQTQRGRDPGGHALVLTEKSSSGWRWQQRPVQIWGRGTRDLSLPTRGETDRCVCMRRPSLNASDGDLTARRKSRALNQTPPTQLICYHALRCLMLLMRVISDIF